jgi:hypothetical protein
VPTGDEMAERGTDRFMQGDRQHHPLLPFEPVKTTPRLDGPSLVIKRKTKIKGVRVVYDVGGGEGVATRDHPTARRWEVTKHGQLILRDKDRKQIARYRQFVWREVIAGDIREGGNGTDTAEQRR